MSCTKHGHFKMNQSSEYFVSCVISQNINCFFYYFLTLQTFNYLTDNFLELYSSISWTYILLYPGFVFSYFLDLYSPISWTNDLLFPGPIFFYFLDQWSHISWTNILLFPGPIFSFIRPILSYSWRLIFLKFSESWTCNCN